MYITRSEFEENNSDINDIFIDTSGHQVKVGQTEINLTLKEFDLLLFFLKKKGKVISRSELLEKVWGASQLNTDRTIDIHVCRLRKKIELNPHHPRHLISIRGLGYKLRG
jgi:DNA-binding response OmpR family regulator